MDASQYKDYILVLLFIKYISDKYYNTPYAPINVPKGASFKDMVALKGKPSIGDDINKKIIAKIAEANQLTGTIDVADFNNAEKLGKGDELVKRLSNLIAIFEDPRLDFTKNRAEGDDLLGDAYEYLMKNFATESGKSKGQFYTPAEVSRIVAKIIGINNEKVSSETTCYDPTCGSGSLLLKVADESEKNISLYGQEMDVATAALARMNMVLHNHASDVQSIVQGNTLANPLFLDQQRLKTFDFAVSNPPFSYKAWSTGLTNDKGAVNDKYGRFDGYGVPPMKNGDYAFLLHLVRSLKSSKGKGAIILPHGVLFRGNAEAEIRENIIRRGYIKGIIGLPANLFYGTGIPACIIVIDKENAENRKGIFMMDASKGYMKDGNKNRLRHQDIHKIVDVFNNQVETPKYSRMVSFIEIEKNEYNLNIPRYIDSQEEEDIQDIDAHLNGGIPKHDIEALQNYWDIYPALKDNLFKRANRSGYLNLRIDKTEIKKCIFEHDEFTAYSKKVNKCFIDWKTKVCIELNNITIGTSPKKLIYSISEDILKAFSKLTLIDKYDIYQHLMTYWTEIMQDDVYLIASDGWKAEFYYDEIKKEYTCDLIPKELVINCYFQKEKQEIEKLKSDRDSINSRIEEMVEEYSGEDGLLEEVKNILGKIIKANVVKRVKEIKGQSDSAEELKVLEEYLVLLENEAEVKTQLKEVEYKLLEKLKKKYQELTITEIKALVVDEKWMAEIYSNVKGELDRISQRLTQRIKEQVERYETPLPVLNKETDNLEKKVNAHLKKMGFTWN